MARCLRCKAGNEWISGVPPSITDDQIWAMIRVYHGFKTDAEMVTVLGYGLELHVVKMKQATQVLME